MATVTVYRYLQYFVGAKHGPLPEEAPPTDTYGTLAVSSCNMAPMEKIQQLDGEPVLSTGLLVDETELDPLGFFWADDWLRPTHH